MDPDSTDAQAPARPDRLSRVAAAGRGGAIAFAILLTSLGESRILDRLLFDDATEYGFVLAAVRGVLDGTPVSRSWQQRVFSPYLVRVLERFAGTPLDALEAFLHGAVLTQNALLFLLVRRAGASTGRALVAVGLFGFARLLSTYRLEYPWDEVDVLLFMAFGFAARRPDVPGWLWPLLAVGTINHETVLYVPFWYLLPDGKPASGAPSPAKRRAIFGAAIAVMCAAIFRLRSALYVGRPAMPENVFEHATPVIENHAHVLHNLRQLFFDDFRRGKVFIGAAVLSAIVGFAYLARAPAYRRAALWSLGVLATIVAFGYVNETRHYLLLLSFWSVYAWPGGRDAVRASVA